MSQWMSERVAAHARVQGHFFLVLRPHTEHENWIDERSMGWSSLVGTDCT